jgi:hypothetical protein
MNIAIAKIIENIIESLDNKTKCNYVLLDLSKAFDCIQHDIPMDKLYKYGIRGIPHKLIESCLRNRTQHVKVTHTEGNQMREYLSGCLLVSYGVPQGLVLGPLLFILYINDIPHLTKGRPIMYADDTSILNVGQDMNELQKTTSNNVEAVQQYFEINNLSMNPSKTHYILFQTRQCRQESNLKILLKNREISNVKSTDFLGVVIDSNLSWEIHIERTCSKISRNIFIINRLSKILDLNERKMLYYSLIYPLLSYRIVVWGHSAKANTTRIFALQQRAVR